MQSIKYATEKCGYSDLRDHQREVLEYVIKGQDCILCAPTGSGKSLIFEVMPHLFHHMENGDMTETPEKSLVIVISPLVALMRSQTKDLCNRGLHAAYLADITQDEDAQDNVMDPDQKFSVKDLKDGKVHILFGSPESLLMAPMKKLLKELTAQVKCLVVDEAHCIQKL